MVEKEWINFMKKALLVIDYTRDFVATDGALTCGIPGQLIEQRISSLIQTFHTQGECIFFLNDLHQKQDPHHPESSLFPPHNIEGTDGRLLYGSIQTIYEKIKNQPNVFSIDKTRYSAFAGTPLALLLNERGIRELTLVGVCTDICILHTAVDAYNLGYDCTIYTDGVASFNKTGHEWALQHFKSSLGFTIKND